MGEQTEALCQSLKQAAPLTLRVNQRHIGRDAYLAKLQSLDIQARACLFSEAGIVLEQSVQITQLPGFEQGWFSVQDEHAQLCATLLPDLNNKTVIDACAAPGVKRLICLKSLNQHSLSPLIRTPVV